MSLEARLVLAVALSVGLFLAVLVAVPIYSAFARAAAQIEAVTQPH